jgi:hypothetical protein
MLSSMRLRFPSPAPLILLMSLIFCSLTTRSRCSPSVLAPLVSLMRPLQDSTTMAPGHATCVDAARPRAPASRATRGPDVTSTRATHGPDVTGTRATRDPDTRATRGPDVANTRATCGHDDFDARPSSGICARPTSARAASGQGVHTPSTPGCYCVSYPSQRCCADPASGESARDGHPREAWFSPAYCISRVHATLTDPEDLSHCSR